MSDNVKRPVEGAEQAAGAAEVITLDTAKDAAEKPAEGGTGVYKHVFKKPFEYAGRTYTELTFNFERLTGRDMVAIETEMQANSEYALASEISLNFQGKLAAKAAGIGSDVMEAMPLKDFNKITNAARSFLLDSGY